MNKKCCELLKEVINKNYNNIRLDNMSCKMMNFIMNLKLMNKLVKMILKN